VIRAVLDTNIIVSAMLMPLGIPARILAAAYASVFRCLSSEAIAAEVSRTLERSRVQRKYHLDPADVARLRGFLRSDLVLTPLTVSVSGVASHPEDDLILATAVSARADYLVTGDRQLLALQSFQGVQIVSPREFLAVLNVP
jgi:putative PIN family toxin of toxin-antitoxin system